jgi:hypothetical protein
VALLVLWLIFLVTTERFDKLTASTRTAASDQDDYQLCYTNYRSKGFQFTRFNFLHGMMIACASRSVHVKTVTFNKSFFRPIPAWRRRPHFTASVAERALFEPRSGDRSRPSVASAAHPHPVGEFARSSESVRMKCEPAERCGRLFLCFLSTARMA